MQKILTILFLFFSITLWGQDSGGDTPINLQFEDVRVQKILKAITRQSGLDFSFNAKTINVKRSITFSVVDATLEEALEQLTAQMGVAFNLVENQIILYLPGNSSIEPIEPEKKNYTISGFLNDEKTGESLIGATVTVLGTSTGSVTNAFGYYALQLEAGLHQLAYSYVGYEMKRTAVNMKADVKKDLNLKQSSIDLPDVIVALPLQQQLEQKQIDRLNFKPIDLENMPEFGGESGLVKGLQALPGIKMHSDGSAFFYTRGGDRDQNLIIIDDAPIYNPSHLFGFYSIVIPDFAKSIDIYKSNIPANLGDRISSIVNIRTRDGNLNKWEFSGALNPLINRLSLEGPTIKKKGAIFLSFRRSNFEWLYKNQNSNASLGFGDFNFKWNHKFSDKNRLFFTVISSGDNFSNSSSDGTGISWGNFAATLRWNHIFGPKLFTNTILYTGNYIYRLDFQGSKWESGIGSLSFKTDFTHFMKANLKAKFGLEWSGYFFIPGQLTTTTEVSLLPQITRNYSRKSLAYYQLEYEPNERFQFTGGLRIPTWENLGPATYFTYDNQYALRDTVVNKRGVYHSYVNVDPRFNFKYNIDSSSHVNLSIGRYHQYLQLISNSTSPFTSLEVWLPASPNIKPQQSSQISLSYLKYFSKPKLSFTTAAYYKQLKHQIDYIPQAQTLLNPQIEGELRFGDLRSYGLEFMLKKETGKFNGWISYNFSRAIRQTETINNGNSYPAFQDRPHDFSLLLNYNISRRVLASAYWTSFSGAAFSSPTGFYTFNNRRIPIYDEKNNDRLPSYRRLDLSFKFILNKKIDARYQHSLTFSIYNALAHKNSIDINFNKYPVEGSRPVIKANVLSQTELSFTQTDLVRFLPSLTYKFKL